MKAVAIASVLISLLSAGCVGTGPNTEQGAVAGGVMGAVAGGIIGHNSRGGNTVGGAAAGAAVGAVAGGVIGNSVDQERGTIYTPSNPPPGQRVATPDDRGRRGKRNRGVPPPPPPTPVDTMPPQPAPNAVWVPGYWIYDGRYTW